MTDPKLDPCHFEKPWASYELFISLDWTGQGSGDGLTLGYEGGKRDVIGVGFLRARRHRGGVARYGI